MHPLMVSSCGFVIGASGLALVTGVMDAPLAQRLSIIGMEAMCWAAGFLFAVSLRKSNHSPR